MSKDNKIFNKLPAILQTDPQRRFYDATVDQMFAKKQVEALDGFIGERVPGFYDPINDYYLAEPNKDRTWYQLDPIAVSADEDNNDTNEYFYQDLIDRIDYYQGNVLNHDRLFDGQYYSFSPPIDLDKYLNYQSYYWVPQGLPTIEMRGIIDNTIITEILGQKHYTYTEGELSIEFTEGLTVTFPDSVGYTNTYTVEGVGDSMILAEVRSKLIKGSPEIPVAWDPCYDAEKAAAGDHSCPEVGPTGCCWNTGTWNTTVRNITEDYMTMGRGAIDGNAWSRTNSWYHKDLISDVANLTGVDILADSTRGRRPILEFFRDLEIFKGGIDFGTEVDLAAVESFFSIQGHQTAVVDGQNLAHDDLLIFLNNKESYVYPEVEIYTTSGHAPYFYQLERPFTDADDIYIVVRRNGYGPLPLDKNTVNGYSDDLYRWGKAPQAVYNPPWYSIEDQENKLYFTAATKGLEWKEKIEITSDGSNTYVVDSNTYPSNVKDAYLMDNSDPSRIIDESTYEITIEVHPDYDPDDNQSTNDLQSRVTVTLLAGIPAIGTPFYLVLDDDIRGVTEDDIIEIYINANFTEEDLPAQEDLLVYDFALPAEDLTLDNVYGVKILNYEFDGQDYDYLQGSEDYSVLARDPIITDTEIKVVLNTGIPNWENATVILYTYFPKKLTLRVSDYVWRVEQIVPSDSAPYLNLAPHPTVNDPAEHGDNVLVTQGATYKGLTFRFDKTVDDGSWLEHEYQKRGPNQAILFNLYYTEFDGEGEARQLEDFPSSDFRGSEIFSYKVNEDSTIDDAVLGFPLEYKNLGQIADIVFEHDLETERYTQVVGTDREEIKGLYYYKNYNVDPVTQEFDPEYNTTWYPFEGDSKQRVIDRYAMQDLSITEYPLTVTPRLLENGNYDAIVNLERAQLTEHVDYEIILGDDITATKIKLLITPVLNNVLQVKSYTYDLVTEDQRGYFEIPQQLKNNPNNQNILEYSQNELTQHFISIMENQLDFAGGALGSSNNYRDTARDPSLGSYILQNQNPLLKTMLVSSSEELDILKAIRFSRNEYVRYKDKIVNTVVQLSKENYAPSTIENQIPVDSWLTEVMTRISVTFEYSDVFEYSYMVAIGDIYAETESTNEQTITIDTAFDVSEQQNIIYVYTKTFNDTTLEFDYVPLLNEIDYSVTGEAPLTISINDYQDKTIVVRTYRDATTIQVPSSPSRVGTYLPAAPVIMYDEQDSVTPTTYIVGHDGSMTPAYGTYDASVAANGSTLTDERDIVLFEFERRVYNNISKEFVNDYNIPLKIDDVRSGFFRTTRYNREEYLSIVESYFYKWRTKYNLNPRLHDDYDPAEWRTWNYATDNLPNNWRGIYEYYYDTTMPSTAPWEMLGFATQPLWWSGEYGADYSSNNVDMWADLEAGTIRLGERAGTDERYARPGLQATYMPVDTNGEIIAPHIIGLVAEPADEDKDNTWVFGDGAPVETAWYRSSEWPFVAQEILYLMRPASFGELLWKPDDIITADVDPLQFVSRDTFKRRSNDTYSVHAELDDNGNRVVHNGYQRFISDRLLALGKDINTEFGDKVRALDVKLGHKLAGFTNNDTLNVFSESTSTGSTNQSLLLPKENINVKTYTGAPTHEFVYSGMIIRVVDDKYELRGYDIMSNRFTMLERISSSKDQQLSVGGTPVDFTYWKTDTLYAVGKYVQYNTVFYQCAVSHTSTNFDPTLWTKLAGLPSVGGAAATWKPATTGNLQYVEYGSQFAKAQDVVDILVGYGAWLESEGWMFETVDNDTNEIQDWKAAAKNFLFWSTTNWEDDNSLFLSPGGDEVRLTVPFGYPANVEQTVNGIYSLMDRDGYGIAPNETVIDRDGKYISASYKGQNAAIYAFRVNTRETEHIITFDNNTIFNDTIFDPLLYSRQKRLNMVGKRTLDWFGKLDAPGYVVTGNKLLPNFDSTVDSIRDYYRLEAVLDNQEVEDLSKHLIGFEERDYLNNLQVLGDTQYQLYQGMIPQKGTVQPVNKLLRSKFISDSQDVSLYEEWAFRKGSFGGLSGNIDYDIRIDGNLLRSDPQIVKLQYPSGPVGTGSVNQIIVTNAVTNFAVEPTIIISAPEDTLLGVTATAEAVLDKDGLITSIEIIREGEGYDAAPTITIQDTETGEVTADTAVTTIYNNITEDLRSDDIITVDIDDRDTWVRRPFLNLDQLTPEIEYNSIDTIIPNAGYVHLDDVDFTAYDIDKMHLLWDLKEVPVLDDYIWIAKLDYTIAWGVYRVEANLNYETNDLVRSITDNEHVNGRAIIDGALYNYSVVTEGEPEYRTIVSVSVTDADGVEYEDPNKLFEDETIFFKLVRYTEDTDPDEPKRWVDNYQGKWAVFDAGIVARSERKLVDSTLIKNALIYEPVTNRSVANLALYDPFKGFIPGQADRNLTYIADMDPTRYNVDDDTLEFSANQVGELWWDTSTSRYIHYEQGDLIYRRDNWGTLFPGSSVDIYEWTRDPNQPEYYEGDGTVKDATQYNEKVEYNALLEEYTTYYYFWVKSRTVIPNDRNRRNLSALNVSRLIANPRTQGYQWWSFIIGDNKTKEYSYIFNNVNYQLRDRQNVFQVNYKLSANDDPAHIEWKLLREGDPESLIPTSFWDKLVDSLTEYDSAGRLVPDPNLTDYEKLGTRVNPVQTWFNDVQEARKVLVQSVNPLLEEILLTEVNPDWNANVNSDTYWEYTTWWADGYDSSVRVTRKVKEPKDLVTLTNLADGEIIEVINDPNLVDNQFYAYTTSTDSFELIGQQGGTIRLKTNMYTDQHRTALSTELRELLNAMRDEIFVDIYLENINTIFFAEVNYTLSEQKNIDWAFKTSYVKLIQEGKELSQDTGYVVDPFESFIEYVNEIKPYQTKIRTYVINYKAPQDTATGTAWDFDDLLALGDDAPFDPLEVPRFMKPKIAFNRTQCGFSDRPIVTDAGVSLVHTAIEEMRLAKNTLLVSTPTTINYDIVSVSDVDNEVITPFSLDNFTMFSGAAIVFLKSQQDLLANVLSFSVNDKPRYSQYTEQNIPATQEEIDSLRLFNERFMEAYDCGFKGLEIDAQEFPFIPTEPWDSKLWDEAPYDSDVPWTIIDGNTQPDTNLTVDGGTFLNYEVGPGITEELVPVRMTENVVFTIDTNEGNYKYIGDGNTTTFDLPIVVNDDDDVRHVSVNGIATEDYTIHLKVDSTTEYVIEFTVAPANEAVIVVTVSTGTASFRYTARDTRGTIFNTNSGQMQDQIGEGWDVGVFAELDIPNAVDTDYVNAWDTGRYDEDKFSSYLIPVSIPSTVAVEDVIVSTQKVILDDEDIVPDEDIVQRTLGTDYEIVTVDQFILAEYNDLVLDNPTLDYDQYENDRLEGLYYEYADLLVDFFIPLGDSVAGKIYIKNVASMVVFNDYHNYYITDQIQGDQIIVEYPLVPVSYRIHLDEMGESKVYRNANEAKTELTRALEYNDKEIEVADSSVLPKASQNSPGIVWIKGERIEYRLKRNNVLYQVTRRTKGTSTRVGEDGLSTYYLGTYVIDGSERQRVLTIDGKSPLNTYWTNSPGGLGLSSTTEALFLQKGRGSAMDPKTPINQGS